MNMAENRKEEKFISLYWAFVNEIYQYVFLRTGLDAAQAEDLTQDYFLEYLRIERIQRTVFEQNVDIQNANKLQTYRSSTSKD